MSRAAAVREILLTSFEMARFQESEVTNDQIAAAAAGGVGHEDHLKNPLNSSVMNSPSEEWITKARKPYTISKQREKWTQDEHKLFLESLQLHGRAWRPYTRAHRQQDCRANQKPRSEILLQAGVTRESSGDGNGNAVAAAPRIRIPPPRHKRKPTHPYPRKLGNSPGKDDAPLEQLDMPQLREVPSLYGQGNDSSNSVLIRAQVVRSPTSSIDAEDRCPAPRIAAVELATQLPSYKVANGDTVSKHATCGIPESPVLRLFGKRVVVNGPNSDIGNQQNAADMELDAAAETPASGTGKFPSCGAAEVNTLSAWPTDTNQFMYYLPQGEVLFMPSDYQFFSYNNGSIASTVLNPQAKQQQHQPTQAADCRFTSGEGSCTESITTSSGVPETSNSVESKQVINNEEDEVIPVAGSRKRGNPTPDRLLGFVPYKRCIAEVEADREMTRLCL